MLHFWPQLPDVYLVELCSDIIFAAMPYTCKNKIVTFHGEDNGVIQDYLQIKKDCLEKHKLFEDDQFPATKCSMYFTKAKQQDSVKWIRPYQIRRNPQFLVDGVSRFDIVQGRLGDCWLLAGFVCVTMNPEVWSFVVPKGQSFQDGYAGVFHFRFWRHGRWTDVVIDDRLPTFRRQFLFLRSTTDNEFWGALLEKAYAKMFGSYEAIETGITIESMVDLSGGVPEVYYLSDKPANLYEIIHKSAHQNAWLTCDTAGVSGKVNANGIVQGHAYNITAVTRVKFDNNPQKQDLLRIRNPWGNAIEWKGAYNDKAEEWKNLSMEDKKKINVECQDDGEFWMHFHDFELNFKRLEICHQSDHFLKDMPGEYGCYKVNICHGSWNNRNGTACGNIQFKSTFHNNPQYRFTLNEHDQCYDHQGKPMDSKKGCTVVISLMQKYRRLHKSEGRKFHYIGLYVYEVPNTGNWPKDKLGQDFFGSRNPGNYTEHVNSREIARRIQLNPGTYVIVPTTEGPNQEAEFMIRILSENPTACKASTH